LLFGIDCWILWKTIVHSCKQGISECYTFIATWNQAQIPYQYSWHKLLGACDLQTYCLWSDVGTFPTKLAQHDIQCHAQLYWNPFTAEIYSLF